VRVPEVAYTVLRKASQQLASDICRQRQELSHSAERLECASQEKTAARDSPTVISEHAFRVIVA
jgi:hypothetical protein